MANTSPFFVDSDESRHLTMRYFELIGFLIIFAVIAWLAWKSM